MHGGAAHLSLDVVPGRPRAVAAGKLHHLRVARVAGVVVAAVAEVDAADERHIAAGRAGGPDHDEFLMAAAPAGAGIEQHLAAVLADPPDELRVGPPPAARRPAQHLTDL